MNNDGNEWVTDSRGTKICRVGDLYHNESGPAVIYPSKRVEWYINGQRYWFDEWCDKVNASEELKLFLIMQHNLSI